MKVFNSYQWLEFELQKADQVPQGRHWQATVFGHRSEYTPGYDQHDQGSYSDVPETKQYAFKERKDLDLFVSQIIRTDSPFVFYEVPALGKVEAHVKTSIEV